MITGALLHGGSVFDGTGTLRRRADGRVRQGSITKVGTGLPPGEKCRETRPGRRSTGLARKQQEAAHGCTGGNPRTAGGQAR